MSDAAGDREGDAAKEGRPRGHKTLLVAAIGLVGLCATAAAIAFAVYDRVTEIDRSTPTVTVREFLQASVVDRDINRIGLFVCNAWDPGDALNAVTTTRAGAAARSSWGVTSVQERGDTADAFVRITTTASGHSDITLLRLTVVREDGWRVCGVDRVDSLDP